MWLANDERGGFTPTLTPTHALSKCSLPSVLFQGQARAASPPHLPHRHGVFAVEGGAMPPGGRQRGAIAIMSSPCQAAWGTKRRCVYAGAGAKVDDIVCIAGIVSIDGTPNLQGKQRSGHATPLRGCWSRSARMRRGTIRRNLTSFPVHIFVGLRVGVRSAESAS
jgi:hypothetical protein